LYKNAFTLAAAAVALLSTIGLIGCGSGPGGKVDTDVAATVNGVDIPVTKVDQVIDRQLKASGPQAPALTPVALAAYRLQVLDQLIQEEALYQRAQKENVSPSDDEVKQALQTQIQQSGMSQDAYQQRLKDFGQTEDELKNDLKRQLAIQKLQDKVTASIPAPTDAELHKYFDENKAQLVAPRGVSLSDIIVDPANNNAGPEDAVGTEAAQRKVQEIVNSLKGGADFATIARNRSEDQSALQGGMIGFFSEQQLASTFPANIAAGLFNMQVGQISAPVQSQDGRFHIFKLNEKREQTKDLTYDEVSPQIAKTITDQRKQVVMSALLIDATSSASIKNNLAALIIEHPDTFGALRPSPLTEQRPGGPAPAAPAQPQTPAPAATNANANTNAAAPAAPKPPAIANAGTKKK